MIAFFSGMFVGMFFCFFFQAEDGIRDLVRSRGLGDVYKRQGEWNDRCPERNGAFRAFGNRNKQDDGEDQWKGYRLSLIHI